MQIMAHSEGKWAGQHSGWFVGHLADVPSVDGLEADDYEADETLAADAAAVRFGVRILRDLAADESWRGCIMAGDYDAMYEVEDEQAVAMLCDYYTGESVRPASRDELAASIAQAAQDGGRGVIQVDGRSVYAQ